MTGTLPQGERNGQPRNHLTPHDGRQKTSPGKKFHPREIEEMLYAHPKVLHAAIIGIEDRRLGERNCLCLIPRPGEEPELGEFVDLLRGRVATYKLPEALEIFEEFPFTPTGKVQRHALARMVAERKAG